MIKSVSIVVEWENALQAADERPRLMLRALSHQISSKALQVTSSEIVVVFDPKVVNQLEITKYVQNALGSPVQPTSLRFLAAPGSEYYAMKNLGARNSVGDVIVFIDSDVVPEPNWLERILSAFDGSERTVVASAPYIECSDILSRTLALVWFFRLRTRSQDIVLAKDWKANSIALRREIALQFPFPEVNGSSRGGETLLRNNFEKVGVKVWLHEGARLGHPAPDGLIATTVRAIAYGRDIQFSGRHRGAHRAFWLFRQGNERLLRYRHEVGIPAWQFPVALAINLYWHGFVLIGTILAKLLPHQMRRRFLL
jgi:glycosyltransferase involved in cell wall biosynthesis